VLQGDGQERVKDWVVDPHWFQWGFRSGSSFLYPDPDPGSQTNADPDSDPSHTLKSQKVEFLHENTSPPIQVVSITKYAKTTFSTSMVKGYCCYIANTFCYGEHNITWMTVNCPPLNVYSCMYLFTIVWLTWNLIPEFPTPLGNPCPQIMSNLRVHIYSSRLDIFLLWRGFLNFFVCLLHWPNIGFHFWNEWYQLLEQQSPLYTLPNTFSPNSLFPNIKYPI